MWRAQEAERWVLLGGSPCWEQASSILVPCDGVGGV